MTDLEVIRGTWFPTGYHGHFRSKSRLDFPNEFRHLAKPLPPRSFFKRTQRGVSDHVFSKHDNRHALVNDALYFEQGLGKGRITTKNTNRWQRDFLTWGPHKTAKDPKISLYTVDFRGPSPKPPHVEKFIRRPETSFDEGLSPTTTYRYAHGKDNPNSARYLDVMNNSGITGTTSVPTQIKRKVRPHTAWAGARESVASCMNWHVPKPPMSARTAKETAPSNNCSQEAPGVTMVTMAPEPTAAVTTATGTE